MIKMVCGIAGICLAAVTGFGATLTEDLATVAALGNLTNAPTMYVDDTSSTIVTIGPGERKGIYFEGLDYLGAPTRIYAQVGIPAGASAGSPVPGIVLVHGGGGTAFSDWVDLWTARGYAAISVAVEGQTDSKEEPVMNTGWHIHNMPGPVRVGIYGDTGVDPITDQWMYHAVADTVLANSLLRSLTEVVADDVGLMGVSWGGVITSTAIGIDERFKFAIPTYGCGNLDESVNFYGDTLKVNDGYKEIWDPMVRIANATMPVLWYSWPTDFHFALTSQADCYNAAPGQRMVSLVPGMGHGHGAAWNRPESYDFADSVIAGTPWCLQQSATVSNGVAQVTFSSTKVLDQAKLVSTIFGGHTGDRVWTETDAVLVNNGGGSYTLSATLPDYTTAWFINGLSGSLVASSDFQETGVVQSNVVYSTTANWSTQTVNPNDLVTLNNGATVTLDQNDEALMLLITEGAILEANQNVTLAVAGTLDIDDGTVNQSDGSISADSISVNSASQYNLAGGVLETESTLDISNGGLLNINGGFFAKDLLASAETNGFELGISGETSGLLQLQAGSLQITNGLVYGVINLYSQMEVSGGDIDLEAQVRANNEFKVVGDTASINFGWMGTYAGSSFVFELNETGVSPINVSSWASLANAGITVDGSVYTGGPGTIDLLDVGNLVSPANANNITVTGFAASGLTASVVQEQAPGHAVRLVIEEQAPESVIYDTTTNWSSQTVNDADAVIIRNNATVTAGQAAVASPDLVVNGSFETPDVATDGDPSSSGFGSVAVGATTMTGWAISGNSVYVIDGFDNFNADLNAIASDGDQFVQLQYNSSAATISQTITTEVGQTYRLAFDYGGIYTSDNDVTLTYSVGGGADQIINSSLIDLAVGQVAWETQLVDFTATATTTTISFTGDFNAGFWGPGIDNVSVTAFAVSLDTAETLTVNDEASPVTATLNIDAEFDLTATTSIELGAGTGAGFVNQSTGTVATAALNINSNGTGDLSQYNLSGGSVSVSDALSVNAKGEFNLTGGTVNSGGTLTIDEAGVLNIYGGTFNRPGIGTIQGGGLLKLQSGTFTSGDDTNTGQVLKTNVEISGGTFSMLNQILFSQGMPLEFKVIGDAASITMRHLQFSSWTGAQGTLKWVLNETGVSTINMTSWMYLNLATIVVDGSAYTGGSTNINLIEGGLRLDGLVDSGKISVTGFAEGYTAEVVQDTDAGDVRLEITFLFDAWMDDHGLTDPNADEEPDGWNNLQEYALGGNPTNHDASAISPVSYTADEGGINWFYYIHNQRTDDSSLIYTLGTKTNLTGSTIWNTNDTIVVGQSIESGGIKSVTNRTEGAAKTKFIKLGLEKNP